jgi:MFS family permease
MLAAPLLSIYSDYYGRRTLLLIGGVGTFAFALCTMLGVMAGSLSWLLIGAFIGGICSRMDPIAQAVVGDVCAPTEKVSAMSYLQLFISIGAFLGPLVGGFLAQRYWFQQLNFALPFIVATALSCIALWLTWRFFPETITIKNSAWREKFQNFKTVLRNRQVWQISIVLILIQISWSTYYQFIAPLLKKQFAFSADQIGFFMGAIAFWLAVAAAVMVFYLQRVFKLENIIRYSCYLILIGLLGTMLSSFFPFLKITNWFFVILVAAGDVITYCAITTLYSNAVSADQQGQVMGASFLLIALVWMLTSFLGGWLFAIHAGLPFGVACVSIVLLLVFFKRLLPQVL